MLEAEKAGEISKVEDPEGGNGVYYSFRQIKIGVEKGARHTQGIDKKVKANQQQAAVLQPQEGGQPENEARQGPSQERRGPPQASNRSPEQAPPGRYEADAKATWLARYSGHISHQKKHGHALELLL